MRQRQLSLRERWELDIESYKKGTNVKIWTPQCFSCENFIKGNALHCKIYTDKEKPKEVLKCKKECLNYVDNNYLKIHITNKKEEIQTLFSSFYKKLHEVDFLCNIEENII